ncbi:Os03g0400500 [Oryza sativa Japonica Group]|uniref:Os03g0400500 protein n=1 Tax=Oryza sativa subsp. japonica TaxID=39947 RepID=A0A0P0VYG3_ORYSJ|nr:Os03g0400500 [Oryza sativa Japonica Group]
MWGDTRRRSTSSRPPERHCRRSPDPFRRSVDARQLSPGMDDYGVDDRHMDGLEGDGDDPMEQLIPKANDDTDLSTPGGEAEPFAPSAGRVERWRHFKKIRVIVDGIGHLNRYYLTHLKDKAPAGARQTQLSFGPDGSVSTWTYEPRVARDEIARYIVSKNLPIRMGENKNFERMIRNAFCP